MFLSEKLKCRAHRRGRTRGKRLFLICKVVAPKSVHISRLTRSSSVLISRHYAETEHSFAINTAMRYCHLYVANTYITHEHTTSLHQHTFQGVWRYMHALIRSILVVCACVNLLDILWMWFQVLFVSSFFVYFTRIADSTRGSAKVC